MKTTLRALVALVVLALGGATMAIAAGSSDPVVGTWTLNLAKSKFSAGHVPKSQTRTYAQSADGTTLTVSGIAGDGSTTSQQVTFKYDGKDYPFSGSPNYDTIALRRVNGTTVKGTLKKDGKVVGTSTRSLSDHGKVLTLTTKATDAKGQKFSDTAVFDRQ